MKNEMGGVFGKTRCGWVDNIKTDLRKKDERVRTGLIWLRIGTGGGHW